MDEIIPGLWIGDFYSALNVENLKAHGIYSILSAMRGRITIHETFIRHQILLDDTEDADVLTHFLPSIHFIRSELGKGRGVLVHCQAGISRSSTIVAAYLMYTQDLDPLAALGLIKKARPGVDPNPGFLRQLEIFHQSRFRISSQDKTVRKFYMDRTVEGVMNGDGSPPETDMFAKFPRSPSDSLPTTPGGGQPRGPRRRIRCKMCRQELAAREHMLDHGQLGPATPAGSRRPSNVDPLTTIIPSSHSRASSFAEPKQRRLSNLGLTMSTMGAEKSADAPGSSGASNATISSSPTNEEGPKVGSSPESLRSISKGILESTSLVSALETEDCDDELSVEGQEPKIPTVGGTLSSDLSIKAAQLLGRRLSNAIQSSPTTELSTPPFAYPGLPVEARSTGRRPSYPDMNRQIATTTVTAAQTTHILNPDDLASQLYINPKLSALHSPPATTTVSNSSPLLKPSSSPIVINPKCSGYFVEPMNWMEHFLKDGQLAGKITCPNKKCNVKLGNYDWAGVCCGCKQWVTPGFCINRSKVDEVMI